MKANFRIYSRTISQKIDWYEVEENEVEKELEELKAQSEYYKDCTIYVNGIETLKF